MKRSDYKNFQWYPVTDEEYWVEEFPEEFPDCITLVINNDTDLEGNPKTYSYLMDTCYLGWGTMAKYGGWKFMIIPIK